MLLTSSYSTIKMAHRRKAKDRKEALTMDKLKLHAEDNKVLGLLDQHPRGLTLLEINESLGQDVTKVIRNLMHTGVLERMPGGKFRTLGQEAQWN